MFSRSDIIIEESIDGKKSDTIRSSNILEEKNINIVKNIILEKYNNEPLTLSEKIKNDFFLKNLSKIKLANEEVGYILVSEQANDILNALKERKDFIIRTVFAVALVILIFSLFINKYILKPIGLLIKYNE